MKSRIIALLSCVTLLLATATVFADTFKPKIYQVFVDDNGLMTILGTGFPEGGYVQTLKVGGIPATDIVYDGVADSVQAQVPAQLGPGDYRLLVNFKLNNNAKNVTWDLSIGPQGPQGEQGEQGKLGEAGDQGVQGKLGPPGEDGPQGEQGKLGPQGVQGKMGLPGLGEQGEQGKLGPQGEQGKIGPQGLDGTGCSLGECSDAGEATLSCGSTDAVIPCVPPPVPCPCAGDGSAPAVWDNGFQAVRCSTGFFGPSSITLEGLFPEGLFVHPPGIFDPFSSTCGIQLPPPAGPPLVQREITDAEVTACTALIQQIAATDGVICSIADF